MAKFFAKQSPVSPDCWTFYQELPAMSLPLFASIPAREKHLQTLCGQTEKSVKEILHKYECPKILRNAVPCDG